MYIFSYLSSFVLRDVDENKSIIFFLTVFFYPIQCYNFILNYTLNVRDNSFAGC